VLIIKSAAEAASQESNAFDEANVRVAMVVLSFLLLKQTSMRTLNQSVD
jgi:hypothetical protein